MTVKNNNNDNNGMTRHAGRRVSPGSLPAVQVLWSTWTPLSRCILGLGGRILPNPNQLDGAGKWRGKKRVYLVYFGNYTWLLSQGKDKNPRKKVIIGYLPSCVHDRSLHCVAWHLCALSPYCGSNPEPTRLKRKKKEKHVWSFIWL